MRAITAIFIFLMLASVGFGATTITGNLGNYNPGNAVNLTVINDNDNADGTYAYANFTNNSYVFSCGQALYNPTTNTANISCILPVDLANGTWNVTLYNAYNFTEDFNTTTQFTLNSTNMSISIEDPKSFAPTHSFTIIMNTTYYNGTEFDINTGNFSVSTNISGTVNCSSPTRFSIGNYTVLCTVNITANATNYSLSGIYPNSNSSDVLVVNVTYGIPNLVLNISSISIEKGNQSHINISIRSNSNVNDTLNVSVLGCDGENLTCQIFSTLSANQTSMGPFALANATLNVTAAAGSNATTYTLTINVTHWDSNAYSNLTTLAVLIYPIHNFSLAAVDSAILNAPAGDTIQYNFSVENTGESAMNYSFACGTNTSDFTCRFNVSNNSVSVANGSSLNVHMNLTIPHNSTLGLVARTIVNVTDYFGLKYSLGGSAFTTTVLEYYGNVTVMNISQYPHYAGEVFYFNITINNTANVDSETIYNITIVGQNLTGWTFNVSNDSSFLNSVFNDTDTVYNFTLSIGNRSSKNISVRVVAPSGATHLNFTKLFIYAVSANNITRHSENASVVVKLPYYNFSINMQYNKVLETLNWTIVNITREPGVALTLTSLNYTLKHGNGRIMAQNSSAILGQIYLNSTSNTTAVWNASNYTMNVSMVSSENYNSSFEGTFYLARWIGLTASASATVSVVTGTSFTLTAACVFESLGTSINVTHADLLTSTFIPAAFYGTTGATPGSGGSCPYILNTTYQYTCTASTTTNSTYYLNVSATATKCSRDFNCTFSTSLTNMTSMTIGEVTNLVEVTVPVGEGGGGDSTPANTTDQAVSTLTGIKFIMPPAVTLSGTQTITIDLNNTNNSLQNLSVTVSEASDYTHFSLSYLVPQNISGNAIDFLKITLTPFKWAKPGTYSISVNINSATGTFSVTVPNPTDSKKVRRYVEVSKDLTKSRVILSAKNKNSYSIVMNITDSIPKQIVPSASAITFPPDAEYVIIEEDPVVMWSLKLSPGQEKEIAYILSGNLGNSNLFNEPVISEAKVERAGLGIGGLSGDTTLIIIAIIIIIAIAAAVAVYFFVLRPEKGKMPIKYASYLKEAKAKGIIAYITGIPNLVMSLFSRKKAEQAEGKKEVPVIKIVNPEGEKQPLSDKFSGLFAKLFFRRGKKPEKAPEQKEEKKAPAAQKPSKEELMKKLKEVYDEK